MGKEIGCLRHLLDYHADTRVMLNVWPSQPLAFPNPSRRPERDLVHKFLMLIYKQRHDLQAT